MASSIAEEASNGSSDKLLPDVMKALQEIDSLNLRSMELLTPVEIRAQVKDVVQNRPASPEVGEIRKGVYPAADKSIQDWILYRPKTSGPHLLVVYFHGGGWVFGNPSVNDQMCRDLCVQTNSIFLSMDYRHAPENKFPAAADDACAAVRWAAENAESLGGISGHIGVAGYSAGGNVAAVACQMAAREGRPLIAAQLLIVPVTDCDFDRKSYKECATGYLVTAKLMDMFWKLYADPSKWTNPRASPLRAESFDRIAPAVIVAAQFDPLRDEALEYAKKLEEAGVPVEVVIAKGHTHNSIEMVHAVSSGSKVRKEAAEAFLKLLR